MEVKYMDKETLSHYGWIVVLILILSVMIALATPFGNYIKMAVKTTTEGLFTVNKDAMNVAGLDMEDVVFGDNTEENGEIEYEDFTITSSNRDKIGYTGTENENLVIPETFYDEENDVWYKVVAIGKSAFSSRSNLASVTIPKTVKTIGASAFYYCDGLSSVIINGDISTIATGTFSYCRNLSSIELPCSIKSFGDDSFYGCSSLINLKFNGTIEQWNAIESRDWNRETFMHTAKCTDGNTRIYVDIRITSKERELVGYTNAQNLNLVIAERFDDPSTGLKHRTVGIGKTSSYNSNGGNFVFSNCNNIVSVTLPNTINFIGYGAFKACKNLKSINWPSKDFRLGDYAFTSCGIESVTIPKTAISIGDYVFSSCDKLTSVTIEDGAVTLGSRTFAEGPRIESLYIPASVKSMYNIFMYSYGGYTKYITVDPANETYCSVDNVVYSKDMKTLILCVPGKTGTLIVPNTVTSISSGAFCCSKLTEVVFPEGLQSIGSRAFYESSIKKVNIPLSVTAIESDCFGRTPTAIQYSGNIAQWFNIMNKSSKWNYRGTTNQTVQCTDGNVIFVGNMNYNSPLKSIMFNGTKAEWLTTLDTIKDGSYWKNSKYTPSNIFVHCTDCCVDKDGTTISCTCSDHT